jgi:hypothetical protein
MASEVAVAKLATMSLENTKPFAHGPCKNMAEWKSQLATVSGLPESYSLTKTLVFKPSISHRLIDQWAQITDLIFRDTQVPNSNPSAPRRT